MATKKAKKTKTTGVIQLEAPSEVDFIEDNSVISDPVTDPESVTPLTGATGITTPLETLTKPVFSLEGVSRSQEYHIRSMLVLADCCVQGSPDRVFDVLARNFDSTGAMEWWLHRIGLGSQVRFVKGKDLVDAIRKLAHELHKVLRQEIGRPVPRW